MTDRAAAPAASVWSADLDRLAVGGSVLSADEEARARRFHDPRHARRYRAARTWLRTVLGRRLETDPAEVRFRYVALGKPVLDGPELLDFSLAHSGPVGLLGVGPPGGLGVDVERLSIGAYERSAASIVLSPAELSWVERADDPDVAFLRCWVRKESYAKIDGTGMDRHLAALTLTGPEAAAPGDVVVHDLRIGTGLVAAVALPKWQSVTYRGRWTGEAAA